ncbi:hypothetical protein NC661_16585 [Aquibacillus koreensis]|uniref:Uncharacterized protein n=1 Tax=Aquibacillus koreensis TaxID=279446 RepID=A0A9X4AJF1_9BACI|nr:hypothetical protein [Aquibacillus koreensis]MCT2536877.1 hypothetical protein [Aquibacillus koreensis]MDC3421991.1 hypothetical protein [Aquibacillus koreensis]
MTVSEFLTGLPLMIGVALFLFVLCLLFIIISLAVRVGIDNSKTSKVLKQILEKTK